MDRRLEMIKAAESHYQALMDRYAMEANTHLEFGTSKALDVLIDCMDKYSHTLAQFNIVQKLKAQILKQNTLPQDDESSPENES